MFLQGVDMPFCKSETFLSSSWKRPRARRMSHPLIWAQATLKCHYYSNTWHYLTFYGAGLFLRHSQISMTLLFSSKEMVPCCKSGFPSPSKKHWQFPKHPLNSMTTRLKGSRYYGHLVYSLWTETRMQKFSKFCLFRGDQKILTGFYDDSL